MDTAHQSSDKILNKIAQVLFAVLYIACFLTGCDPMIGSYPCEADAVWICTDPDIVLCYQYDNQGVLQSQETIGIIDNTNGEEQTVVSIHYCSDSFYIFPDSADGYVDYDAILISGTWSYRNNDLIFKIEKDSIFNYKYEEVVFVKDADG